MTRVGGRAGAFWSSGPQLNTLLATQGQDPPSSDLRWRIKDDRFFADPSKLEDLIPSPQGAAGVPGVRGDSA